MGRGRRKFTKEFKGEAVRLAREGERTIRETAEALGIGEPALRRWIKNYETSPLNSFPGNGNARDEEVSKLRLEVKRLRMERDILKKATAFFAKENQ